MDSKFRHLAQKIHLFISNNVQDIELLIAAADLKNEIDRMVNNLIEVKNEQTRIQKITQMILIKSAPVSRV